MKLFTTKDESVSDHCCKILWLEFRGRLYALKGWSYTRDENKKS